MSSLMRGKSQNRLHAIEIKRDESIMQKFDEKIPKFIHDMDEHLNKLGFAFGDQWKDFK